MYGDFEKDVLYVYMVPGKPGDLAGVDKAIGDIFGANRPSEHNLQIVEGRYTFLQLNEWDAKLLQHVLKIPGVVVTGIDHAKNRMRVGVKTSAAAPDVQAELVALGIPLEAVAIEEMSPRLENPAPAQEPDVFSNQSVQSCFGGLGRFAGLTGIQCFNRPLVGGLQVQANWPNQFETCTNSFIATRGKTLGFVTCSHCGKDGFGGSGTVFGQPLESDLSLDVFRIGLETVNPPLVNPLTCDTQTCPEDDECRCSDTLFGQLNPLSGLLSSQGYVAQPADMQVAWNGTDYYTIASQAANGTNLMVGALVTMVGRTSGRQSGKITQVCQNINLAEGGILLCQYQADYTSASGDSGAPVFTCLDSNGNPVACTAQTATANVQLVGVHEGVYETNDPVNGPYFGPIWLVQGANDLGALKVCVPGKGC
jgi:hypothetical protein